MEAVWLSVQKNKKNSGGQRACARPECNRACRAAITAQATISTVLYVRDRNETALRSLRYSKQSNSLQSCREHRPHNSTSDPMVAKEITSTSEIPCTAHARGSTSLSLELSRTLSFGSFPRTGSMLDVATRIYPLPSACTFHVTPPPHSTYPESRADARLADARTPYQNRFHPCLTGSCHSGLRRGCVLSAVAAGVCGRVPSPGAFWCLDLVTTPLIWSLLP
jgi:hypothetical protein